MNVKFVSFSNKTHPKHLTSMNDSNHKNHRKPSTLQSLATFEGVVNWKSWVLLQLPGVLPTPSAVFPAKKNTVAVVSAFLMKDTRG